MTCDIRSLCSCRSSLIGLSPPLLEPDGDLTLSLWLGVGEMNSSSSSEETRLIFWMSMRGKLASSSGYCGSACCGLLAAPVFVSRGSLLTAGPETPVDRDVLAPLSRFIPLPGARNPPLLALEYISLADGP